MIAAGATATPSVWDALTNANNLITISSALGFVLAGAIVWAKTRSGVAASDRRTENQTLKDLEDGLRAATLRADAEAARADQQTQLCASLEVKNAELLNSTVGDQTRHLAIEKTLGSRIVDLERQLGKPHDDQ